MLSAVHQPVKEEVVDYDNALEAAAHVGIPYDTIDPARARNELRKNGQTTYKNNQEEKLEQDRNTKNATADPYRNETRTRWMNRSWKEPRAYLSRNQSEYAPNYPQQLTEQDFWVQKPGPQDVNPHRVTPSFRDRNPRYADEHILALQEGAALVDDMDANHVSDYNAKTGTFVHPQIRWATTLPLQYAYSPTLPFFRAPHLATAGKPSEQEPPYPVGNCDSTGWLDRYAVQRMTPWVYVSPSSYSQTDIQYRTPRMDVLTGSPQLTTAYTHYSAGGIPCVTNALSRDFPYGGKHDLSYAHMAVEDAVEEELRTQDSFNMKLHRLHSPWEQGVSLVHFKFGSTDLQLVGTAWYTAETRRVAAEAERTRAVAAAQQARAAADQMSTKRQTAQTDFNRLAQEAATRQEELAAAEAELEQLRASLSRCRAPHLGGHLEGDPRAAKRLVAVAEQTAIKWMEDCGLSLSVTLRDDQDPVGAGRRCNLLLRPPVEAFALWQGNGSMWTTVMGWGESARDNDLATYQVNESHVAKYKDNFEYGPYRWVARRFSYRPPGTGALSSDGERLWTTGTLLEDSPWEKWDTIYMRTRAYESRLLSSKRYYLSYPIELLSSSATLSPAGFREGVDAGCLGCIYTGVSTFGAFANGLRYAWPNPMRNMLMYLTGAEVKAAWRESKQTDKATWADGFYRVAIVFKEPKGHETSVEHVIPRHIIRAAARLGAGNGSVAARVRQGSTLPLIDDWAVRARFADYVCGDPFNWLVSVAHPNRRRGSLPLGVCDDDLADLVVARRPGTSYPSAREADSDREADRDVVRGSHDHLFPVPRKAWLRVALVQVYMYLTYPGLPPLLGDDKEGSLLSAQGWPLEEVDSVVGEGAPILVAKQHARFGVPASDSQAFFMLPDFDEAATSDSGPGPHGIPENAEMRGAAQLGREWGWAVLRDSTQWSLIGPSQPRGSAFPTWWTDVFVSARTGRVVLTEEKRVKLFRTLLRTVALDELCEADVHLASLVQKATGFMLSEYEQMCQRLEETRDDNSPLTSSDGAYAAWTGNSDGTYGATIRTRYPRGWRNPLFHWSNRRRHAFVQQPTVYRFLGAAMYGLSREAAATAAAEAKEDVKSAWGETPP